MQYYISCPYINVSVPSISAAYLHHRYALSKQNKIWPFHPKRYEEIAINFGCYVRSTDAITLLFIETINFLNCV
jgi:hypothetical protein